MAIDISNKIVLVIGVNWGIGKVLVEFFLEYGVVKVYVVVRKLESVVFLVDKYGNKIVFILIDLVDLEFIVVVV